MKLINFLEKKCAITKEVLELLLLVIVAYALSLAMLYVHNYILELTFSLLALGGLGNLYVISFNDNKMPVPVASRTIGTLRKKYPKRGVCKLTNRTKLAWLADRFILKLWKRPLYWSIGDLIVTAGVVVALIGIFTKTIV